MAKLTTKLMLNLDEHDSYALDAAISRENLIRQRDGKPMLNKTSFIRSSLRLETPEDLDAARIMAARIVIRLKRRQGKKAGDALTLATDLFNLLAQ